MKSTITLLMVLLPSLAMGALSEPDRALMIGRNLLLNPGAENGKAGVLNLDTTTTAANIVSGKAAFLIAPSGSGQDFSFAGVVITSGAGVSGRNGVLSCEVKTTMTDLKMQVYDGTNVISPNGTTDVVPSSSAGFKRYAVNFVFPVSGTLYPRFYSGSAGTAYVDDCYFGLAEGFNLGIVNVIEGWTPYAPVGATGFGTSPTYAIQRARLGDTLLLRGSVVVGSSPSGSITLPLPPGLSIDLNKLGTAYSSTNYVTLGDASAVIVKGDASNSAVGSVIQYSTSLTSFSFANAAGSTVSLWGGTVPFALVASDKLHFEVNIPIVGWTAQNVYRPDTTPGYWSGYHNKAGNGWATTLTTPVDPTPSDSTSPLIEVQSRNLTVVTASGNLPGITFTPPKSGRYEVCSSANLTTSALSTIFGRLVDGGGAVVSQGGNATITTASYRTNIAACGIVNAPSTSPVTVKWQIAGNGGTTTIENSLAITGGAINWTISQLDAATGTPFFVGSIVNSSSGVSGAEAAQLYIAASGCAVNSQLGNWISNPNTCSTGYATFTMTGFKTAPYCTVNPYGTSGAVTCNVRSVSATSIAVSCFTTTTGANVDLNATLHCTGGK